MPDSLAEGCIFDISVPLSLNLVAKLRLLLSMVKRLVLTSVGAMVSPPILLGNMDGFAALSAV